MTEERPISPGDIEDDADGSDRAIQIADRIWWVGRKIPGDQFQCNAYLIENGENSLLLDPGGYLTFDTVCRRVAEVIPFSNIRYFICHHQDPDVAGALRVLDKHPQRSPEAVIITHWRAIQLLKHYDVSIPFLDIEEHEWRIDAGGRVLKFIFTPYLHFPGAFCTFDEQCGVLFSSDIFGGFTKKWRLTADESYFDGMRPFHEHYMPSREILMHSLLKIEKFPIKLIAPQHGSVIPEELVPDVIDKLKQIDCGIYAMAMESTDIMRLSALNKALKDITNVVVKYRDLKDITKALSGILRSVVSVDRVEFYAGTGDGEALLFSPENDYRGTAEFLPEYCRGILGVGKSAWNASHPGGYKLVCLLSEDKSPGSVPGKEALLVPLFYQDSVNSEGVAVISLEKQFKRGFEIDGMIGQVEKTLGVALERETFYHTLDLERQKFYNRSIRDPLTGLYNRMYMDEFIKKIMHLHDRDRGENLSLVMLDIDFFKRINDTFGHTAGDEVLKRVGMEILKNTREGDLPVRYGGEEFALFLPRCGKEEALRAAERIRKAISSTDLSPFIQGEKVTVSAGVALRRSKESLKDFLQKADRALYEAKNTGRDRVCAAWWGAESED
ncbi:MAG: diguanylate cyclase [Thermodesulfobacteriota bacterium]